MIAGFSQAGLRFPVGMLTAVGAAGVAGLAAASIRPATLFLVALTAVLLVAATVDVGRALALWAVCIGLYPDWAGVDSWLGYITPRLLLTDALLLGLLAGGMHSGRLRVPSRLRVPFALFAAAVAASLAVNPSPSAVFWSCQLLLFVPCAFLAGRSLERDDVETLLRWIVNVGVLVALAAALEILTGWTPFGLAAGGEGDVPLLRGDYQRAELGFGHPLALGLFLVLAFGTALVQHRFLASAVIAGGAVATVSRGPIIAIVVALLVFALSRASLKRLVVVASIVALLLVAPGPFPSFLRGFFADSVALGGSPAASEAAGNAAGRVYLADGAWKASLQQPLGHGVGTATSGEAEYVAYGGVTLTDIANTYLAVLLDLGFLGLIATLWTLWRLAVHLRRHDALAPIIAEGVAWLGVFIVGSIPVFFLVAGALWGLSEAAPRHHTQLVIRRVSHEP